MNVVFDKKTANERKSSFERRVRIKCTVPWLSAPLALLLTNGERRINVGVDPTQIEEGTAAFGEVMCFLYLSFLTVSSQVQGFDVEQGEQPGPLFRFPVTIIRPMSVQGGLYCSSLELTTAKLSRVFLSVPTVCPIPPLCFLISNLSLP